MGLWHGLCVVLSAGAVLSPSTRRIDQRCGFIIIQMGFKMKHLTSTMIAAAAALLVGSQASAATMVTQWEVDLTAQWTAAGPAGVSLSPSVLTWGTSTGFGQSSLSITNPPQNLLANTYVGGGVPPLVNTVQTLTLTHTNRPITGTSLQNATLNVSLALSPNLPSPSGPIPGVAPINYAIQFLETPNTSGTCVVAGSPVPCNDIFVLTSGLLNEAVNYDGFTYYVNAFPIGGTGTLQTLATPVCTAAGAAAGCLGFTTVENTANNLIFGLAISTVPLSVPEPAGLALVGLALAGAGMARRRVTPTV